MDITEVMDRNWFEFLLDRAEMDLTGESPADPVDIDEVFALQNRFQELAAGLSQLGEDLSHCQERGRVLCTDTTRANINDLREMFNLRAVAVV